MPNGNCILVHSGGCLFANDYAMDLDILPVIHYTLRCPVCGCHIMGIPEKKYTGRLIFTHIDTSKYNDCPNSLRRFVMRGVEVYRLD